MPFSFKLHKSTLHTCLHRRHGRSFLNHTTSPPSSAPSPEQRQQPRDLIAPSLFNSLPDQNTHAPLPFRCSCRRRRPRPSFFVFPLPPSFPLLSLFFSLSLSSLLLHSFLPQPSLSSSPLLTTSLSPRHLDDLWASLLILSHRLCLFCPFCDVCTGAYAPRRNTHSTTTSTCLHSPTLVELLSCTSLPFHPFTLSRFHASLSNPTPHCSCFYYPRPSRPSANNKRHPVAGTKLPSHLFLPAHPRPLRSHSFNALP